MKESTDQISVNPPEGSMMDFNPPRASTPRTEIKRRPPPTMGGRRLGLGPIRETKEEVNASSLAGVSRVAARSTLQRNIGQQVVIDSSLDDSLESIEAPKEMPPKKAAVKEKPEQIVVLDESVTESHPESLDSEGGQGRKNSPPPTPPEEEGPKSRKRPTPEEVPTDSPPPVEKKLARGRAKVGEETKPSRDEEKKLENDKAVKKLLEEDNYLYSKPEEKKRKEEESDDHVLDVVNDILDKSKGPGTRSRKKATPTTAKEEEVPPKRGRGRKKAAPVEEPEEVDEDEEIHVEAEEPAGYEEKVGKWLESQVDPTDETEVKDDEDEEEEEDEDEEPPPTAKRKAGPKKPVRRKKGEVEKLMESQVRSEKPRSQRTLRSKDDDSKITKSPKHENGSVIDEVEELLDSLDRVKCQKGEMEICFGKNRVLYLTVFPASVVNFYFYEDKEIKVLKGQGRLFAEKKSSPLSKKVTKKVDGESEGRIENANKRTPLIVFFSEPSAFNNH